MTDDQYDAILAVIDHVKTDDHLLDSDAYATDIVRIIEGEPGPSGTYAVVMRNADSGLVLRFYEGENEQAATEAAIEENTHDDLALVAPVPTQTTAPVALVGRTAPDFADYDYDVTVTVEGGGYYKGRLSNRDNGLVTISPDDEHWADLNPDKIVSITHDGEYAYEPRFHG